MGTGFSTRFEDHQGLIHKICNKFFQTSMVAHLSIDYDDLFAQASLAFVKASQGYDPDRGITFTAYMGRAINNELIKQFEREFDSAYVVLGKLETEEVEDGKRKKVRNTAKCSRHLSLDKPVDEEGETSMYDVLALSNSACPQEILSRQQQVADSFRKLSERARTVVLELVEPSEKLREYMESVGKHDGSSVTIDLISRCYDYGSKVRQAIRKELSEVYGVDVIRQKGMPRGPDGSRREDEPMRQLSRSEDMHAFS